MNLVLEKGEKIAMGDNGRGEIGGETGEVTGVVCRCTYHGWLGKKVWNV